MVSFMFHSAGSLFRTRLQVPQKQPHETKDRRYRSQVELVFFILIEKDRVQRGNDRWLQYLHRMEIVLETLPERPQKVQLVVWGLEVIYFVHWSMSGFVVVYTYDCVCAPCACSASRGHKRALELPEDGCESP